MLEDLPPLRYDMPESAGGSGDGDVVAGDSGRGSSDDLLDSSDISRGVLHGLASLLACLVVLYAQKYQDYRDDILYDRAQRRQSAVTDKGDGADEVESETGGDDE